MVLIPIARHGLEILINAFWVRIFGAVLAGMKGAICNTPDI